MAVVVTKAIKKKRIMLAAFAALVLASAAVIYFGIFSGTRPQLEPLPLTGQAGSDGNAVPSKEDAVADLKIKILEDERFKELQASPGVPIKTEAAGKRNPFSE